MKKIIYIVVLFISAIGFSQSNKELIRTYLEDNKSQLKLSSQDISDWILESEVNGSGTKITSCFILQRFNGIEIFNAQSNISIKDGKVIQIGNNFQSNISQKINATSPSITVIQAINKVYNLLGISPFNTIAILDSNLHHYTLTDGNQEELIHAKLVYERVIDNSLKLAWAFQFYSPDSKHLWDIRIDALNSTILKQNDLNLNCNFGKPSIVNTKSKQNFSFEKQVFNPKSNSVLAFNPASYRVIPYNYESPNHHPFELITTVGNALASPNGWHDSNALGGTITTLNYTYSRGNNVLAQEDADGNNGNGIRAEGTTALNFDFPYGGQNLQPTAYTSAATTNLFYTINTIHDIWYQYGFDEASGNFQQNNYGRGGAVTATGDYVLADAQDGYSQTTATLNNANFSTPNDGARPRVQMFLWDVGAPATEFIRVNSPANISGTREATTNIFEGTDRIPVPLAPNGITSNLVHYENEPNPNTNIISIHNACIPPTNAFALNGKIALIRRGNCSFSNKVKNAQDAGATAVIIMDSIANNPLRLSMSSTGILGITIPAIFITKEIGDELLLEMANGDVNITLESPAGLYLFADGDFDNGIIGHEVGHGISNRLIGGPTNSSCMTNGEQMGEGWSDWFGLMLQIKPEDTGSEARGIGTYAINEPITGGGIRAFPYSTDFGINPLTLTDSNDNEPHNRGETWTAVLWDLTWAYIDKYGFDPDIYNGTGGNNKVMRLVIDALKLQACNTASFISSRDNIFAADQATTNGEDFCLIATVFEKRGMGLNASSGDVNIGTDQVEDFTPFPAGPNCLLAVDYFKNDDLVRIFPNPTNGLLNIRINKFVGKLTYQLIDINGRVILNQTENNFNIEKSINISNLESGVYILKITGNDLNYSQKLIKN